MILLWCTDYPCHRDAVKLCLKGMHIHLKTRSSLVDVGDVAFLISPFKSPKYLGDNICDAIRNIYLPTSGKEEPIPPAVRKVQHKVNKNAYQRIRDFLAHVVHGRAPHDAKSNTLPKPSTHKPRILLLYGSLRARSYRMSNLPHDLSNLPCSPLAPSSGGASLQSRLSRSGQAPPVVGEVHGLRGALHGYIRVSRLHLE